MKRYIRSSVTSSKTVDDSNVKASTDNYNPYSFMVGDQLEWSGLYGGEYKGVVTDVTDEYITVDVMWIAEDSGKLVTNTRRFEIATDPEGRECIIVYRYRGTAGYVYPPSNDYINSAEEYFDKVYGKCISEANQDINTIRRMYANNEGAPSTILLNLGYTEDESGEAFTKSMHTAGHIYETVFNFAKYDWEDGPVLMYVLRDGEVPKGWTVTKFDLYDEEGNVISSAIDPYSEEDDPAEFNSVEDYLKYNIEKGYIDWLSLPSEENDDFDDDDFYDIVYQIESAIAKVAREGEYKICVPNQFEEENGAFCAVIANGKRYAVEGRGNTWILTESDESVESCSNVKSLRKVHASDASTYDDIDEELLDILDELSDMGYDIHDEADIKMGLGAGLGYDKQDQKLIMKDLRKRKMIASSSFKPSILADDQIEDGWGTDVRGILDLPFARAEDLMYEIRNTIRGAYTHCETVEDLADYIRQLASEFEEAADELESL